MELDKFVTSSLLQIVNGVKEAQAQVGSGVVNPHVRSGVSDKIKEINFDVALTVTDAVDAGAEAKISVLGSTLGAGSKGLSSTETVSRIQFTVPVRYPESSSG